MSIAVFISLTENKEIAQIPEHSLVVGYKNMPLFKPMIELRRVDGDVLARKYVSENLDLTYVEVHYDDTGIVILSGDSDWVWGNDLWKREKMNNSTKASP